MELGTSQLGTDAIARALGLDDADQAQRLVRAALEHLPRRFSTPA